MESLYVFTSPPQECTYLPERVSEMRYELVRTMTVEEYARRMREGWRRFGHALFRPACQHCDRCLSLRIPVSTFRPNRSQRRAAKANADLRLVIGAPAVDRVKLDLYDRFHAFQTDRKGWPYHDPKSASEYAQSFVQNPFPTQEWRYYLGSELVGVGYVDSLPGGLSAIYFYYDPDRRDRSLGTYNVVRILEEAARRGTPYVYLGYFVEGCTSLEYKANFEPNEVYAGGQWVPFRV